MIHALSGIRVCCALLGLIAATLFGLSAPAQAQMTKEEFDRGNALVSAGLEAAKTGDYATAGEKYQSACDIGYPYGCLNLGLLHLRGQGRPVDEAQARAYFQQGCQLKDERQGAGASCFNHAHMLENGKGGAVDEAGARQMLTEACMLRYQTGCLRLGVFAQEGRGGAVDRQLAYNAYKNACVLKSGSGCFLAASYRDVGTMDDPISDPEGPSFWEFIEKSCGFGYERGCEKLAQKPASE